MDYSDTQHASTFIQSPVVQPGHWQPALRPDSIIPQSRTVGAVKVTSASAAPTTPDENFRSLEHYDPSPQQIYKGAGQDAVAPARQWGWDHPQDDDESSFNFSQKVQHSSSNTFGPSRSPSTGIFYHDEQPTEENEDGIDPAWGLSRSNTAQILGSIKRSSSFPDIVEPQIQESISETGTPTEDQNLSDLIDTKQVQSSQFESATFDNTSEPSSPGANSQSLALDYVGATTSHAIGSLGVSNMEESAEARFDEGMPLVQNDELTEESTVDRDNEADREPSSPQLSDDEETSFFANMPQADETLHRSPELQRKSTRNVLDSLHMASTTEPDSPKEVPQADTMAFDDEPDFLQHIIEASTATDDSKSTAITQPAVDSDLLHASADMSTETHKPEAGVIDADAMWQAALDDDEFLVEDLDDLLADSDPGSPSSFIATLHNDNAPVNKEVIPSPVANTQAQQTPPRDSRPGLTQRTSTLNPYAPHQPSGLDLTQLSPTTYGNVGLTRPGLSPMNSFQAHLQQLPPAPVQTKSFVDQAKSGYKSPYDLPMELSKSRRRPAVPQHVQVSKPMAPPPRSSSISEKQLQSPFSPTAPGFPSTVLSPLNQGIPEVPQRSQSTVTQPGAGSKPKPSSFFEELPITSRPRPATGMGRYTPQQPPTIPVPQLLPQSPPMVQASIPQPHPPPPQQPDPYSQFQLRPPDRLDPFATTSVPVQPPVSLAGPPSTRYSPAPPHGVNAQKPTPSPRYSPAPPPAPSSASSTSRYASQPVSTNLPVQPPPLNRVASFNASNASNNVPALPFQPRTSSPLAYASAPPIPQSAPQTLRSAAPAYQQPAEMAFQPPSMFQSSLPSQIPLRRSPPREPSLDGLVNGLQRSQTQSPTRQRTMPMANPHFAEDVNRPFSAHDLASPPGSSKQAQRFVPIRPIAQPRGVADDLEFVQPVDETQNDPLQRWKGAPVFNFGFGGTTVSTFPKRVPRYGTGSVRPVIKPMVGEITTRNIQNMITLPDYVSSFPGPLRTKAKKKELLLWMTAAIARIEAETSSSFPSSTDLLKRHDEKVYLWKLLRSLVEHDGVLDTTVDTLKSVNKILCPEVHALDDATATQYPVDGSSAGSYHPSGSAARADLVDPMAVDTLRKHLLKGSRKDAVWHAVDNRLWSHAMLISSTLDRSVWKQVVQEFVKQEVKTAGTNMESLSALYEIFGGNMEESIDQLVPPSARAGLQMVNRADASGPTKNALDGLDQWKETLSLVINNRSQGDNQALAVLARLLGDYGRVEASHICYMFSRNTAQPTTFGGADDLQASIVLLGVDNRTRPFDFARDHEAIMLTEIYEFATMTLAGSSSSIMHYLSSYKLHKASVLADAGYKAEAQAYCDFIASTLKSSTKLSPYYHTVLLGELDELSNRLKQVPIQSSGSWITKPSLDRVSGSVWNKFTNFVAGDDSDADSKASGKDAAEQGPFARVTGTPTISRQGSQTDLYSAYPPVAQPAGPPTIAKSRYAPNGMSSARSSSELTRSRASLDSQRSRPSSSYGQIGRPSPYEPMSMLQPEPPLAPTNPYQSVAASPPKSNHQSTPPQTSYVPRSVTQASPARYVSHAPPPPSQETYVPTPPPEELMQQSFEPSAIPRPVAGYDNQDHSPHFGGYVPQVVDEVEMPSLTGEDEQTPLGYGPPQPDFGYNHQDSSVSEPPLATDSYDPPAQVYGYEPPEDAGYVPYEPEPESPEEAKSKPKKKSFMDDEDDFPQMSKTATSATNSSSRPQSSAGQLTSEEIARRKANDAAADAAFRAAAEADAAATREKDKTLKTKSSWFGGWLGAGAKKEDGALDAAPAGKSGGNEPKVYKANLGEKKMKLYYDEKLKKWVNPDNPDAALKSSTPPPPPRSAGTPGPPRAASTAPPQASPAGLVGSGPPSRAATPASAGSPAPGGGLMLPPPPPPNSTTNSRPSTAMSNTGSLDDLIGPATGRKSIKGKKGGKGGRYVDVMAL